MRILRILLFVPLAAVIGSALGLAQTQPEMTADACRELQRVETEMQKTLDQIAREQPYAKDAIFLAKLNAAQKAWVEFREAHLEALYPADRKRETYGSVYRMCRCVALTELTKKRVEGLKKWIDGERAQEACVGSVRIRN
jgi:uncharacterized protein YecT (DUF1311 family)